MTSLIEEQNRLYEKIFDFPLSKKLIFCRYKTSLDNDREVQNGIIEERLVQFSDLISRLKEKQSILDDEREREESLKSLNELSPRSRRRLFLEKMESRNTIEEEKIKEETLIEERENPFFNITIEESKQIPVENKFAYRIGEHLFLFDARKLLQDGNVNLDNRGRVECISIPIELPIADENTDIEDDPGFETLKYSIIDPIVLQIFEDAAGITGIPSPEKVHKSKKNGNFVDTYNEEDLLSDGDDVIEMSISDEIDHDGVNRDIKKDNVDVKELIESVFSRLSTLGIFYQREESLTIVESLIVNYLECGYPQETIIENVVATFI